jgi:ribosomal protein S18 acetylase RimI-like enzyme
MNKEQQTNPTFIEIIEFRVPLIQEIIPILYASVIDEESKQPIEPEIRQITSYLEGSKDSLLRTRTYLIARSAYCLGIVGITVPEQNTCSYWQVNPEHTVELVNFFVLPEFRGQYVGQKLFNQVCREAISRSARQLVLDSGPRYQGAWGFYDRYCDQSGWLVNKYGEGRHAKTWIKYV